MKPSWFQIRLLLTGIQPNSKQKQNHKKNIQHNQFPQLPKSIHLLPFLDMQRERETVTVCSLLCKWLCFVRNEGVKRAFSSPNARKKRLKKKKKVVGFHQKRGKWRITMITILRILLLNLNAICYAASFSNRTFLGFMMV